jgi:aconitate hydratase
MFDLASVRRLYDSFAARHALARGRVGRALTYAEKVLLSHLVDLEGTDLVRGKTQVDVRVDRVAMQDATAQMALLQFMTAGRGKVAVPTTVHCDHLIRARIGAKDDLLVAYDENREVYEFLRTVSERYGIGFWKPGAGIIHQVVLETYAFPGGLMIGTDSHTPNAGGLGMIAIGVGGADAVDAMVGDPWSVRLPKLVGVRLHGAPSGWTSPKDVILKLAGILTVKGGTGKIVEYFGDGTRALSCTGKGTITNMGAELGATTSLFPFDDRMATYLRATGRADLATLAESHASELVADPEVAKSPEKFYDEVVEIDLSKLEPHVVGPHTPDLARPVSELAAAVAKEGYPAVLKAALVGSCTNSSYEDIGRAAHVARQASAAGLKVKTPLLITPGSDQIHATIARDGQLADLERIGGKVLANACGPCIGQWQREDIGPGEKNSIINSFNRNFPARNDGNRETLSFIASPEVVTAFALVGRLDVDPIHGEIQTPDGKKLRLTPPEAPELPARGFASGASGFVAPPDDGSGVVVRIDPESERLQALSPFPAWNGKDYEKLPILVKAKGKCTTDHISPAGKWLRFRGHLDKISDNMFIGAVNAFTEEVGTGTDALSGERKVGFAKIARHYKSAGIGWVTVGDENYGEGSSREHAAMSPRWLGALAILAKSFARIHETNLKKQGVLPLTFAKAADYDRFRETDRVSILGLSSIAPGKPLTARIHHEDGTTDDVETTHTFTPQQIEWFRAGSALNVRKPAAA